MTRTQVGGRAARWALPAVATALLAYGFVLRARLIDTLSVHWDEYNFLAKAHLAARGELTRSLQTFHGHLFSWLPQVSASEIDQVIAARWVMFALAVVAAGALVVIGRRLLGGSSGVFAAFVFGSFWYVLHHGTSFRYDGIIAAAFLVVVALLVSAPARLWPAAAAGVVAGVSLLVSIKSALYFPAFVVVLLAPLLAEARPRDVIRRAVAFATSGLLTSAALFVWHKGTLARVSTPAADFAGRAIDKMLNLGRPFPRRSALLGTLGWDAAIWLLLGIGLVIVVVWLRRGDRRERVRLVSLLALATPLLSLYFYRNAWPYFYVSALPGACLLAGAAWRCVEERAAQRPLLAAAAVVAMAAPVVTTASLWVANNGRQENAPHRDLVSAVHEIFPEPVPYIDRCGMVASFPKVNFFMTTWGMNLYRRRGVPIMEDLLRTTQPKLLLHNTPFLDLEAEEPRGGRYSLTDRDFDVLRQSFIPHWGRVWVAGKVLEVPRDEELRFELLIGGPYTLESDAPVELDGRVYQPSDVVTLSPGAHHARALGEAPLSVTLRYGDHLRRPAREPIDRRDIFRGFRAKLPAFRPLSLLERALGEWNAPRSPVRPRVDDDDDDDDDEEEDPEDQP